MTAKMIARRRRAALTGSLAAAAATLALAAPAPALAAPQVGVAVNHLPTPGIAAGGYARYEIAVSNTGDAPIGDPGNPADTGLINVTLALPPASHLQITNVTDGLVPLFGIPAWNCAIAGDSQSVSCAGPDFYDIGLSPMGPGEEACEADLGPDACRIEVTVAADSGLGRGSVAPTVHADASAYGAGTADASDPTDTWRHFDVTRFDGANTDGAGNPFTQAGGHPDQTTVTFTTTTTLDPNSGGVIGSDDIKDASVDLPPGLLGDPSAVSTRCTEAQLVISACPSDSQVGTLSIADDGVFVPGDETDAIYNMVPPPGRPASFGADLAEGVLWTHLYPSVRTGGDYGITIHSDAGLNQFVPENVVSATFWGVPADPSHDAQRSGAGCNAGCASGLPEKAFLSLPTSCTGSQPLTLRAEPWLDPGNFVDAAFDLPGNDGCAALDYSSPSTKPTIQARPTTDVADSPSGLAVDVHTPQNDDPNGVAEAHLKDTVITLPEGFVVNPSGANGLSACSPAQIDLHGAGAPNCPDTSKVGTVEVDTPLIDHPLPGAIYVATPHDNPFDSLLAVYITVNDPQSGTVIKLAGKVDLDPNTGRLTTTVTDAPQLPFEHFKVNVKSGAGAPLRTPATCGNYTTTSTLTPWSAPDAASATPSDTYAIDQGPNGGACSNAESDEPNSPTLDAGTVSPVAGAFSPLVVNLSRDDGSQQFSTVTLTPPPGLLGKLAGTPYCPQSALDAAAANTGAAEQANPSCPADSQIGTVSAAAGAGPSPYYAPGKVYMAGPYKGAPLSLAIVTPATAGPFDLGTVVVRTALHIDPATAQITAVSDPIPTIMQGIPLDVRSARISLDKPNFTLNGTSCNPLSFSGSLLSTLGQAAPLSERFQLGECSSLGFKPKLALSLKGGTKRNGHPAFTSVLTYPQGNYANLAKAAVTLPGTMQLDQSHIQAPCTRPQFAANQCPAASVIGTATATSPLVDYQLTGPVYLRTGNNPLPDIVLALHGPASQPIEVDVVGKVDTVHAQLRTTFETVPDAPVSQAVISLQGASKGLLVNNTDLCAHKNNATVLLDGQNGKTADSSPAVKVAGCKPKRKHHKHHKLHRRHLQRHGAR